MKKHKNLYCSNRYSEGKLHIAKNKFASKDNHDVQKSFCGVMRTVYLNLNNINLFQDHCKATYNRFCKKCLKKLSKEEQELIKYNAIVAKLKS